MYGVFSLFLTLCVLALQACIFSRSWLEHVRVRLLMLYKALPESETLLKEFRPEEDLPLKLYNQLASLVIAALIVLILFWAVMLVRLVRQAIRELPDIEE